ncbi:polysaccharide deacetylase family protein [Actinocorallia sp. A-T 12471]|uniref:polysaccharide deacetylase family protein n=1 Tax=Actinocorallia sp. A-T 12471 TaxID=3089813 RepID=UPI0029CF589F|nr:polysaccharide deacetylase family protein [Actinocorallia sp. A-T 12471]MDX6739922.1 polysaccharide deacetylase family protein [Actinocorallia sp. A-T 12471]
MKRLVAALAVLAALAACGQAPDRVHTSADADAPVVVRPMVFREPDPDMRRGLGPDGRPDLCARAKCVALTFDDGPMEHTERLLEMLARYDAKATFFVVGQMVEEFPEVVRKEVEQGHEIANHSWNHANLASLSADGVTAQIQRTQDAILQHSGYRSVLLRPPYGSSNAQVAKIAASFGLPEIIWAVDPLDWRDRNSSLIARRVLSQTGKGDVVLLHDIHASTVDAVPRILEGLAAKGFKFVTVSTLFAGTELKPGHQYRERHAAVAR